MTCLRAYRELARLELQGWDIAITSAFAGDDGQHPGADLREPGVLVVARFGAREIRGVGRCVGDVAPEVLRQAYAWRPATTIAA